MLYTHIDKSEGESEEAGRREVGREGGREGGEGGNQIHGDTSQQCRFEYLCGCEFV